MRAGPAVAVIACVAIAACGPARPEPQPPPPPPPAKPSPQMEVVTSVVILAACPDWKRVDSTRARKEIEELVGPCIQVPGGAAHFAATLMPGGRVELASPSGDTAGGTVPTCVVQTARQLRHRLKLKSPCSFDVKLEERRDAMHPTP